MKRRSFLKAGVAGFVGLLGLGGVCKAAYAAISERSWIRKPKHNVRGKTWFVANDTVYRGDLVKDLGGGRCATLSEALGKSKAGRGDVIYVMPGHCESINTTLDTSNISVVGLGAGNNRPRFTYK